MAYVYRQECTYTCDRCGKIGGSWRTERRNEGGRGTYVSYTDAVKLARRDGWRVGKAKWVCPQCQRRGNSSD